jgi:hypothetical protein
MRSHVRSRSAWILLGMSGAFLLAGSCISHDVKMEPIEIKPIHLTMDINLTIRRELDEVFDFEDKPATSRAADTASRDQEIGQ